VGILVQDADLRTKLGTNAVKIMEKLWNPKVAAERIVEFCNGLLNEEIIRFKDGPCSKAEIISQKYGN
jgi:hypothetical protein